MIAFVIVVAPTAVLFVGLVVEPAVTGAVAVLSPAAIAVASLTVLAAVKNGFAGAGGLYAYLWIEFNQSTWATYTFHSPDPICIPTLPVKLSLSVVSLVASLSVVSLVESM